MTCLLFLGEAVTSGGYHRLSSSENVAICNPCTSRAIRGNTVRECSLAAVQTLSGCQTSQHTRLQESLSVATRVKQRSSSSPRRVIHYLSAERNPD